MKKLFILLLLVLGFGVLQAQQRVKGSLIVENQFGLPKLASSDTAFLYTRADGWVDTITIKQLLNVIYSGDTFAHTDPDSLYIRYCDSCLSDSSGGWAFSGDTVIIDTNGISECISSYDSQTNILVVCGDTFQLVFNGWWTKVIGTTVTYLIPNDNTNWGVGIGTNATIAKLAVRTPDKIGLTVHSDSKWGIIGSSSGVGFPGITAMTSANNSIALESQISDKNSTVFYGNVSSQSQDLTTPTVYFRRQAGSDANITSTLLTLQDASNTSGSITGKFVEIIKGNPVAITQFSIDVDGNTYTKGTMTIGDIPTIVSMPDTFLLVPSISGRIEKMPFQAGGVITVYDSVPTAVDTFYVASDTIFHGGWKRAGDTIFIDTTSSFGNRPIWAVPDTFNVAYDNIRYEGVVRSGDIIHIDTTMNKDSIYVLYGQNLPKVAKWIRNDTLYIDTIPSEILSGVRDSVYVLYGDSLPKINGWVKNDTVYIDTIPSGIGGNVRDSVYVRYGLNLSKVDRWVRNDTINIDTIPNHVGLMDSIFINYGNFPALVDGWVKDGNTVYIDTTAYGSVTYNGDVYYSGLYWRLDGDSLFPTNTSYNVIIGDSVSTLDAKLTVDGNIAFSKDFVLYRDGKLFLHSKGNDSLNIFLGTLSARNMTNVSHNNVGIGDSVMARTTQASGNVVIGMKNLSKTALASGNVIVGNGIMMDSANYNNRNTIIGDGAMMNNANGQNNVAIGWHAGWEETSTNAQLFIESLGGSSNPLIWGDFLNDSLVISGHLAVDGGGTSPNRLYYFPYVAGSEGKILKLGADGKTLEWRNDSIGGGTQYWTHSIVGHKLYPIEYTQDSIGIFTSAPNNRIQVARLINFNDAKYSTALGKDALYSQTTGQYNTAVGYEALKNITNTNGNTAVGSGVLGTTTGSNNTGVGYAVFSKLGNYTGNVGIGNNVFNNSTIGNGNVAIGSSVNPNGTGSHGNTLIGSSVVANGNLTGNNNVVVGNSSASALTTATQNTLIGYSTSPNLMSGATNVAIGSNTLYNNISGSSNIAIGKQAGYNEVGSNKLYIDNTNSTKFSSFIYGDMSGSAGNDSLIVNGYLTVGNGSSRSYSFPQRIGGAGQVLTVPNTGKQLIWSSQSNNSQYWDSLTGVLFPRTWATTRISIDTNRIPSTYGVFYVNRFLKYNPTNRTTFEGYDAGRNAVISGGDQAENITAYGHESLKFLTTGDNNQAFGHRALMEVTIGSHNTAMGDNTLQHTAAGTYNTAIGCSVFPNLAGGDENVVLGNHSAEQMTSGSNNVIIGVNTGNYLTSGSGNVLIGHEVASDINFGTQSASNQLVIDNKSSNKYNAFIWGDMGNDSLVINGLLGIGNSISDSPSNPDRKYFFAPNQGNPGDVLTFPNKGKILQWKPSGDNTPDSVYIKLADTCFADSSGWAMIGDTIFIDTCNTSPYYGCEYYEYRNDTLFICDSTFYLDYKGFWTKGTSETGRVTIYPNDITDNVAIGKISSNAKLDISATSGTALKISKTGSTGYGIQVVSEALTPAITSYSSGSNENSYGVFGESVNSVGIYGKTDNSNSYAIVSDGRLKIKTIPNSISDSILVDSAGVVKKRFIPDLGGGNSIYYVSYPDSIVLKESGDTIYIPNAIVQDTTIINQTGNITVSGDFPTYTIGINDTNYLRTTGDTAYNNYLFNGVINVKTSGFGQVNIQADTNTTRSSLFVNSSPNRTFPTVWINDVEDNVQPTLTVDSRSLTAAVNIINSYNGNDTSNVSINASGKIKVDGRATMNGNIFAPNLPLDTATYALGIKPDGKIVKLTAIPEDEPDSLYIRYDSLCLIDSSGWVLVGDTIIIDTCSTSPFKGCDTSSYNSTTNVLTICDSIYTLVWTDLWARNSIGIYNTLSPRTITDRVSIGTINGTAGMLNITGSGNNIGQTINTDQSDALDIWTNSSGSGIYVNNSNGGNTGEGLRLNTKAYSYSGNDQSLYSRNWGGGTSAEFWQQSMFNTTHGGNISPYNPTVKITRGDGISNSVNWYNSILDLVNDVTTSGTNGGYYIRAYQDETVDTINFSVDINGNTYTKGKLKVGDIPLSTTTPVSDSVLVVSGDTVKYKLASSLGMGGGVSSVTGTYPIKSSGGSTPDISIRNVLVDTVNYNYGIGKDILVNKTTGYGNVGLGEKALYSNTTGYNNIAIGDSTLLTGTNTHYNTAIGLNALKTTTGIDNIGIGQASIMSNTTGSYNTALGNRTLSNITGNYNTAIGLQALASTLTGDFNTAVGGHSLNGITGSGNIGLGWQTGGNINTLSNRLFISSIQRASAREDTTKSIVYGYMDSDSSKQRLTFNAKLYTPLIPTDTATYMLGVQVSNGKVIKKSMVGLSASDTANNVRKYIIDAAGDLIVGTGNNAYTKLSKGTSRSILVAGVTTPAWMTGLYIDSTAFNYGLGNNIFNSRTSGVNNTGLGYRALYSIAGNSDATAVGYKALYTNTAAENTAIGTEALYSNSSGTSNVAMGYRSLYTMSTNGGSTAVGYKALYNATGGENHAFGAVAGYSVTSGTKNILIGDWAGYYITQGSRNVAIGVGNAIKVSTGNDNVFVGAESGSNSLSTNTSGVVAVGANTLTYSKGDRNTAIGFNSMANQGVTGTANTCIGAYSGYTISSGINNAALGASALGNSTTGSNLIGLGAYAGDYNAALSNRLYINSLDRSNIAGDTTKSIIYGYMDATATNQRLTLNAKTTITPQLKLLANKATDTLLVIRNDAAGNDSVMVLNAKGQLMVQKNSPVNTTASINSSGAIWSGDGTNFAEIDPTVGIKLGGTATVWDDAQFPFSTGEAAGTGYPQFDSDSMWYHFVVDTTGVTKCIVYFSDCQLSHRWLEGSTVYPHVHYKHTTAQGTPTFGIKYRWVNIGDTPGAWSWIRLTETTSTTDTKHAVVSNSNGISGAGKTISSILQMKIYLISQTGTGGIDAFGSDMHFEINTMGSSTETSK